MRSRFLVIAPSAISDTFLCLFTMGFVFFMFPIVGNADPLDLSKPPICAVPALGNYSADNLFSEYVSMRSQCEANSRAAHDKFYASNQDPRIGPQPRVVTVSACNGAYKNMAEISKNYLDKKSTLTIKIESICNSLPECELEATGSNGTFDMAKCLSGFAAKVNDIAKKQLEMSQLLIQAKADIKPYQEATQAALERYRADQQAIDSARMSSQTLVSHVCESGPEFCQTTIDRQERVGNERALDSISASPVAAIDENDKKIDSVDNESFGLRPMISQAAVNRQVVDAKAGGANSVNEYSQNIGTLMREQETAVTKLSQFQTNVDENARIYAEAALKYQQQAEALETRAKSISGASMLPSGGSVIDGIKTARSTVKDAKDVIGIVKKVGSGSDGIKSSSGASSSASKTASETKQAIKLNDSKSVGASARVPNDSNKEVVENEPNNNRYEFSQSAGISLSKNEKNKNDNVNSKGASRMSESGTGVSISSPDGPKLGIPSTYSLKDENKKNNNDSINSNDEILRAVTGGLSNSNFRLEGTETDDLVKKLVDKFKNAPNADQIEREYPILLSEGEKFEFPERVLASQGEPAIQGRDSETLFARHRVLLIRYQKGGKIQGLKNPL
jgi:hypothetical protein